jgi:hypothetical protein
MHARTYSHIKIKALEHLGQTKLALTEIQAINRDQASDETREIEKRLKEAVAGQSRFAQTCTCFSTEVST